MSDGGPGHIVGPGYVVGPLDVSFMSFFHTFEAGGLLQSPFFSLPSFSFSFIWGSCGAPRHGWDMGIPYGGVVWTVGSCVRGGGRDAFG